MDNAGIIGVGAGLKASSTPAGAGTIIIANFASGDAIQSHASIQHPLFRGLVITRRPAAVSGFGLNLNTICDFALLSDLWITGHVVGLNLSTTGYSKADSSLQAMPQQLIVGQNVVKRAAGFAVTMLACGNSPPNYTSNVLAWISHTN